MDYSHAYFILPASIFYVWYKRSTFPSLVSQTKLCTVISSILFVLGLLLFLLGWRKDYLFISTFSMLPVLAGVTGYLYGPKVLRAAAFPILYLLFLVPPPLGVLDAITIPMRYGASVAAVFILQCLNLPVSRDGLLLFLGRQEIFMAPACSGFRSLVTFLSLALLYVQFIPCGLKKKVILIASVIPLAFFGNLVRVLLLCLVTYLLGEEAGQGFLHEFSGIMVFLIIVCGFMLIDKLYDEDEL